MKILKKKNKIPNLTKKKDKVVMVSGGFDPVHHGHIRYLQAAKKLGDKLVVVINNDHWIKLKKGHGFMKAKERAEIIRAIRGVDEVVITNHIKNTKDMSVCKELRKIKPDIFANGGDKFAHNTPELKLCQDLGIKTVFNVGHGGKVRSSSDLLKKYSKHLKK
jgi:D-beta-D-heptose 7-phosphate kinase/D-beta-D-heptose 1-phosphate adenosyltransferase